MALGSTQPLTKMSAKNLLGGKRRPTHKFDITAPSVSRLSRKCVSLVVSQPCWPSRPVTEIALPLPLQTVTELKAGVNKELCTHYWLLRKEM
jgi:hypothetical protein